MSEELKRAFLFVDGDCGCALLGDDLQSGECEFVKIEEDKNPDVDTARRACTRAYHALKKRLAPVEFTYVMQAPDGSHWHGR